MTIEYKITWNMPSIIWAARFEDIKDYTELWDEIPWMNKDTVNITTDRKMAFDQYNNLKRWEETKSQPIRNVKMFQREIDPHEWEPVE